MMLGNSWGVKVPFDEDGLLWITNRTGKERVLFSTEAQADKWASDCGWKTYIIEQINDKEEEE